jgi:ribose transport system permease protein
MPVSIAILLSLVIGTIIGFINGFFVVHQKNEPFVITFGMGILIKGIALQLTDARPIGPSDMSFMDLANTKIFGTIKILVLVMIVVLAILHYVLRYTQYGRNCYAVGGDYEVAVYAGINARRTKWAAFIISGFTAALAGIVLASKQASGNPVLGDAIPLLVHCGAVIGGTSLTGGKGGIIQTFLGLLSLFLLWNVLSFLRVDGYIQVLIQGIVIASILWFDNFQAKRIREVV